MAFLTINGIDIPVVSCSLEKEYVDDNGARGTTGAYRGDPRYTKRAWSFQSMPVTIAHSEALQGLVEGRGQVMDMESGQTARSGLPIEGTTGTLGMIATTHPNHNLGWAFASTSSNRYLPVLSPSSYTILASIHTHNGAGGWAYRNLIRRSDNTVFIDGVTRADNDDLFIISSTFGVVNVASNGLWLQSNRGGTAAQSWVASQAKSVGDILFVSGSGVFRCTVAGTTGGSAPTWNTATYGALTTDGTVTWKCLDGGPGGFTDGRQVFAALVYLPFAIPDSWAVQANARFNLSTVWSNLPWLEATGNFNGGGGTVTVAGEVTGVEAVTMNGTSYEAVSFILREV